MVKEENIEEIETASETKAVGVIVPKLEDTELLLPVPPHENKSELFQRSVQNNIPSSSSSRLRFNLISMGFSPPLVDKAIDKHGEEDMDLLIEFLCSQPVVQALKSELDNLDNRHSDDDDNASSFELSFTDEEIEEQKPLMHDLDKKQCLLRMNFSMEDAELATSELGHNASLSELIDYIIASQIARADQGNNVITTEILFKIREKSLRLLEMGFTEEEISTAIECFSPAASVDKLADSIISKRFADGRIKKEDDSWPDKNARELDEYESKCQLMGDGAKHIFSDTNQWESKPSTSNHGSCDLEETREAKRPKWVPVKDKSYSSLLHTQEEDGGEIKPPCFSMGSTSNIPEYEEEEEKLFRRVTPQKAFTKISRNNCPTPPPYFFFGNVTDSSQETWNKLSRFLPGTEPEYVNTQFFSAFIRKEVYFHNLPTENRSHIFPKPAMTIEEALPDTKRWWPSWDTRKQLGCIAYDSSGAACICERLGRMLICSKGILNKEQQVDTLHHCKTLNLLWVGEHKLKPIEPDNVEYILGYPMEHTRINALGDNDRMRALRYSFQVDTLGYHLSPLKQLYPDGLRVLSVFSGIGGTEITLTRLGIHLRLAVSVESSDINRKILKRWWQDTGQSGVLRQIDGVEKLSGARIKKLIDEFGGFDLVISGNPHNYKYGVPHVDTSEGVDFTLFHELVRIFKSVKDSMALR